MTARTPLDRQTCAAISKPVLQAFLSACQNLGLDRREICRAAGSTSEKRLQHWMKLCNTGGDLYITGARLTRMGAVVAIHHRMTRLFPHAADLHLWVRSTNHGPILRGRRPVDVLLGEKDSEIIAMREAIDLWLSLPQLRNIQVERRDMTMRRTPPP